MPVPELRNAPYGASRPMKTNARYGGMELVESGRWKIARRRLCEWLDTGSPASFFVLMLVWIRIAPARTVWRTAMSTRGHAPPISLMISGGKVQVARADIFLAHPLDICA